MKTLIATALVLSAGIAQAQSFDYQRQIGSPDLFPTLATEDVVTVDTDANPNFAYQIAVDTPDLFPTLDSAGHGGISGDRTVFEYQRNIGTQELDPSLS